MKRVFRFKIIILLVAAMGLFSCKKADGYSDQIETNIEPVDSTEAVQDTTASTKPTDANSTTAPSSQETGTSGNDASESSQGTGIGPGESPEDASTYTGSSGMQKDSIKPEVKASKKKKQ
ncbi:hypothetical protein [Flavobacterium gelatinilyticum]|uniref:hypothetical protein n=1 Tax=Flavobacterium gelatinilyticum TaxID=3003260 RepID=UPI002480FCD6|nr:hypothetical protein [Flavobacterium gelatinilyticum]